MSAAPNFLHEAMLSLGTSYRLAHSGVTVDGTERLDFSRYPYIPAIIDEEKASRITILKGAQMGFTIACIMRVLEHAKRGKMRGIGYFFPTEGEVSDFAKARFGPMMTNNYDLWGRHVQDTDSAALKRVGSTHLYFRGMGQKGSGTGRSTSKVKSIPLDEMVLDERDEMDDSRVDEAYHRLDASKMRLLLELSTPTLPGYGVDFEYARSDQRAWMWRCPSCNEWTCLELTYPDCIAEPTNKDPYYLCSAKRCGRELQRVEGEWVARRTDVADHAGFWVSQLSLINRPASAIVAEVERSLLTGRRRALENQVFARAFAEVDEEITAAMLEALLTTEARPLRHAGPCAMGVDPGKPIWYEVSVRLTERDSLVIDRGRVDSYEDLSRVVTKFNVKSGVIDQGYDPSAVAAFCKAHPGFYGALYVGGKKTEPDWDHREKTVKLGRTRTLDVARDAILAGRVKHVQKDEFWINSFVPQMTNLKRATIVKDRTGDEEGVWVVTGGQKNDHLRHADAYCRVAETRVPLSAEVTRLRSQVAEREPTARPRSPWTL